MGVLLFFGEKKQIDFSHEKSSTVHILTRYRHDVRELKKFRLNFSKSNPCRPLQKSLSEETQS